jgi:type II secretory pathway predicted ATPase ExeA
MFESHFGLRENPFASGHQPRFVYPSREHQEALAHLRYGIENLEPFVLITGEVGTGKTTALFEALGELKSRVSVALITNSALTRSELLEEICLRFGLTLNAPLTKPQAMAQLERHLHALRARGERAILLLDEAQNLDRDLLEEIRLLSNLEAGGEKLLQIFLVGQPELEAKLSRPELRQLRQRIAVHYRLRPLGPEDTARYVHHRVSVAGGYAPDVFPHDACVEVYAVTNGIPREINQICTQAMLDAFVDGSPSVRPEHVRTAAQETAFQSVLPAGEFDPRIPPPGEPPSRAPAGEETALVEGLELAAEAARWEAWLASLARIHGERAAATESGPAGPVAPAASRPPRVEVPPAPPIGPTDRPPTPALEPTPSGSESQPVREPTPAAPDAHYAAESAPEPTRTAEPSTAGGDWRPPLWTPGQPPAVAPRSRTLPPRLADKMLEAEGTSSTGFKWLVGVAALAVAVIGTILLFRFGPLKKYASQMPTLLAGVVRSETPSEPERGGPAGVPAEARPTTTAPPMVSTAPRPAPAASSPLMPSGAATPPPSPSPIPVQAPQAAFLPPTPPTRSAEAPKPAERVPRPAVTRQFSIVVGSYLDRSRADAELARITSASGLAGRLAPVPQEGVTMYAVVIGGFPSRGAAERTASDLISRGLVDEARIIARSTAPKP